MERERERTQVSDPNDKYRTMSEVWYRGVISKLRDEKEELRAEVEQLRDRLGDAYQEIHDLRREQECRA